MQISPYRSVIDLDYHGDFVDRVRIKVAPTAEGNRTYEPQLVMMQRGSAIFDVGMRYVRFIAESAVSPASGGSSLDYTLNLYLLRGYDPVEDSSFRVDTALQDGRITQLVINWGDAYETVEASDLDGVLYPHTFLAPGDYEVNIQAVFADEMTNGSLMATIKVTVV